MPVDEKSREGAPPTGRELAGTVALVTGASRGIGLAIAWRLGRMGASVSLCARNAPKLDIVAREMSSAGIAALAVPADVTCVEDVATACERTRTKFGPLDLLVNNAGIGIFGPFHERNDDEWDKVLNTNLKSVFLMSRAVATEMIRRGSGQIINISSLAGKSVFAGGGIYCASKWGLMGLSGCMAEELRAHGVRVSVICPGSVATEFSPHAGRDPEKLLQSDDVAHAVAMMAMEGPHSFISEVQIRPRQKA